MHQMEISINSYPYSSNTSQLTQRKKTDISLNSKKDIEEQKSAEQQTSWKRILLLIIAITVHNIPGTRKHS